MIDLRPMRIGLVDGLRRLASDAFSGTPSRRLALGLLLAYVLAAPFPWGSVQPGLTGTGKITAGAFLVALAAFASPDVRLRLDGLAAPLAAFSGLALLGFVQAAPLPAGLVRAVSPHSAEAWDGAGRVLAAFDRPAPAARLSLAPWETAGVALLVLAFAALFLAASVLLARRAARRLFGLAILASALLQVAIAVSSDDRSTRLHASFVNPNHLAGYLELAIPFALGLIWYASRTSLSELLATSSADERSERIVSALPSVAAAVVLLGVLVAGVVLTQSRGGILAVGGGTLVYVSLAFGVRRDASRARRAAGAILALLVVLGTAFAIAGAGTVAFLRFLLPDAADLAGDFRLLIWKDSLSAFARFPWLGSGLGTFRESIRAVQSPLVTGLVDQAHDEYLQLLVTGGLAGALLGAAALVLGLRAFLRALREQKHREESAFGLAGLGALVFLLLHGVAEFNFSIPAIPATLAACLGGAWAALAWHRSDEPEAAFSEGREPERRRRSRPEPA